MMNYNAMMEDLCNDPDFLAWLDERAEEAMVLEAMEKGVALF